MKTTDDARTRLAARLREINAEIRAYPQPIARCDAQLGGLVEERAKLHAELEALGAEQPDSNTR
jgi:chromosome segregation ATPase